MINSSWLLYQGKNFPKSNNNYKLSEGDVLKIGRIIIVIREIRINNNSNIDYSVSHNVTDEFSTSNNIIINNDIINNISIENNNNNNLNIRKINPLIFHKLKFQNEKESDIIFKKINKKKINSKSDSITLSQTNLNEEQTNQTSNDKNNKKIDLFNLNIQYKNKQNKHIALNKPKRICRVCYLEEDTLNDKNPLIQPCSCSGSLKYIHLNCLLKWISTKILIKKSYFSNTNYFIVFSINKIECELCKQKLPDYIMHKGKIYSLIDFDYNKEDNSNYLTFDAYCQDQGQNRYRYIIKFDKEKIINIGRGNEANVILNDISISRVHFQLTFVKNQLFLRDLNSKFGTLVLIQNPCLQILKGKILTVQIGRNFFCFDYCQNFSLFCCCNTDEINNKLSYEKLNRKYVYLNNFSNIKEENDNSDDDKDSNFSDSDKIRDFSQSDNNYYLKVIEEENNIIDFNNLQGEITKRTNINDNNNTNKNIEN